MKLVVVLLLSSCGFAQQSSTTSGPCSPIAPNNSGSITINCPGMSKEQGKKMIDILNKILKNQIDPSVVMEKLDEILKAVNPNLPVKTYFCNGQWRIAGPSATAYLEMQTGGDDSALKQMIRLNGAHDAEGLLKECLAQIRSAPEWLTPRLFCTVAYLATGDKAKAKEMLTYYDSRKGPPYDTSVCPQMSDSLHGLIQ